MEKFLQLLAAGISLGSIYALVALGFAIVFKATGTINFAHGGFVVLGAFLVFNYSVTWGLPFYLSIVLAVASMALVGVLVERTILRRMIGQPVFSTIMVTIGLLFVLQQLVQTIWPDPTVSLDHPWRNQTVEVGGVIVAHRDIWTVAFAGALVIAFFLFFRYSKTGVAMRATAFDQEAALAQGINVSFIFAVSWAIAGVVAVLAGVMLGAGGTELDATLGFVAFRAFPAIILGGLDSPAGAVVGGVIIGVSEVMTSGYISSSTSFDWLGENFHLVMPYIVMLAFLMFRPYGLFGTREVVRV